MAKTTICDLLISYNNGRNADFKNVEVSAKQNSVEFVGGNGHKIIIPFSNVLKVDMNVIAEGEE